MGLDLGMGGEASNGVELMDIGTSLSLSLVLSRARSY